jgi:hypothetical protein
VAALGVSDPLLDEGVEELTRVVETAAEHAPGLVVADLRIARGLDYYTGTVYETFLDGAGRSARSAPAAGTTTSPPPAPRATRASGCRSGSPGSSAGCSAAPS